MEIPLDLFTKRDQSFRFSGEHESPDGILLCFVLLYFDGIIPYFSNYSQAIFKGKTPQVNENKTVPTSVHVF